MQPCGSPRARHGRLLDGLLPLQRRRRDRRSVVVVHRVTSLRFGATVWYEEGILSVVLRTVISRGRDEYGAVEKTLKGILTICTLLVFPVVVALWWTIYIGVKRFRYGGSVVPAMPSASGIRVFTMISEGCSTRVPSRAVRLHDHVSREF